MEDVASRFREYMFLERRRSAEGLTPAELARWTALKRLLAQRLAPGLSARHADQRASVRVPTRLRVAFSSRGELRRCLMTNLSRGGVFVATPEPADMGTRLELEIRVEETGESIRVPTEVASVDVGPDFPVEQHGMGLRFLEHPPEVARLLDALYERKGLEAAEKLRP